MAWQLAKLESGKLSVSAPAAAVIAAIIAAVPPIVGAGVDRFIMTRAQTSTLAVEISKFDLERRKAVTTILQSALANPDSTQRRLLVGLLVAARVLDDTSRVAQLPSEQLPYWPGWAAKTP